MVVKIWLGCPLLVVSIIQLTETDDQYYEKYWELGRLGTNLEHCKMKEKGITDDETNQNLNRLYFEVLEYM